MKKIICFLLSCIFIFSFAACGNSGAADVPETTAAPEIAAMQYYFMTGDGASVGYEKYTTRWGDSCLIKFPDGKNMLIDTGIQDFYPILKESLEKLGVSTINYMVFSHPHNDHAGGAWRDLFKDFTIEQVYHNGAKNLGWSDGAHIEVLCEKYNVPCTAWSAGDTMDFGDVHMQVLWPTKEAIEQLQPIDTDPAINSLSLVMRFDYGEHSSLFTGDIYQNRNASNMEIQVDGYEGTEEILVSGWQKEYLDVDLIKLPHHGNPLTSCSTKFLKAVSPKYAVATSFEPVEPYFSYYKTRSLTCPVYFDRMYGNVTVEATDDGNMTVTTSRTDYLKDFGKDWNESEKIKK